MRKNRSRKNRSTGIKFVKNGKTYYREPKYSKGASVYFICCQSPDKQIKIGVSRDPKSRLEHLSTANPYPLTLLYSVAFKCEADAYATETMLHDKFKKSKSRGEWFTGLNMDYAILLSNKAAEDAIVRDDSIAANLDMAHITSVHEQF